MPALIGALILAAFVVGAIPFANVATRWARGADLRDVGSGTVSGTALYRTAGFAPLALAGLADVAKGSWGPLVIGPGHPGWALAAGAAAIVGHNWSPFLHGEGGRGISPALGALAVLAWPGAVVLLGALTIGALVHRTGLVCLVGELALTPVLAATSGGHGAVIGGVVAVPMLLKRAMGNQSARPGWRAFVHRLVFDHEPDGAAS